MNKLIEAALYKCQEQTAKTGNEYGIALNYGYKTVFEIEGEKQGITIPESLQGDLEIYSHVFVHSHPNNSCLSIQDLTCAWRFNLIVYAITPRGDIFSANNVRDIRTCIFAHDNEHTIYKRIVARDVFNAETLKTLNELEIHPVWEQTSRDSEAMKYSSVLTAQTTEDIRNVKIITAPYRCCY